MNEPKRKVRIVVRETVLLLLCAVIAVLVEMRIEGRGTLHSLVMVLGFYGCFLVGRSVVWVCFNVRSVRIAMPRFWSRLAIGIVVTLTLGVPGAIATLLLAPARYTAEANLRLRAFIPQIVTVDDEAEWNRAAYDQFVNTQICLMTGPTVLARVVDRLGASEMPSLRDVPDPVEFLQSVITARLRGRSELVAVTCTLPVPEDAQRVLHALLDTYLEHAQMESAEETSERLILLTDELCALQANLDQQVCEIDTIEGEFRDLAVVNRPEAESGRALQETVHDARAEVSELQASLRERESDLAEVTGLLERVDEGSPIYAFGVEDLVQTDPCVSALRQAIITVEVDLLRTEQGQIPGSAEPVTTVSKMESIKERLALAEREARGRILAGMAAEARRLVARAKEAVTGAEAELAEREQRVAAMSDEASRARADRVHQHSRLKELEWNVSETRTQLGLIRRQIDAIRRRRKRPPGYQDSRKRGFPRTLTSGQDFGSWRSW